MSISRLMQMGAAAPTGPEGAWDLSFAYYDPPESLAWNLSTAVYASKSFSVSAQETSPQELFFKPDGLKMYVIGATGDDVNEYDLSTAWDISTASYLQNFSISAQETTPRGLVFKPDGLKMYVVGASGVNQYDLSTARDISTASFLQNFSVSAQETSPSGLFFKPDGLKIYVCGFSGDDVNEYDLSTAWDISTASYLQNFSVTAQEASPQGVFFRPDGLKMYIVGNIGVEVNEYDLSTAWDISTASFLQNFSVSAQDTQPTGLFFKPDGTTFYVVGIGNDTVYQYTLGGFSVAAQETNPQELFFKPDGLKMYVVGTSGQDVNEYDLSTAWDVSTASFLQNFSVSAQDTSPRTIFFKPDGTKMYVGANVNDSIYEYDLSTAWDISTASFLQSFSVAAQETNPLGLFFKPDGLKMYVVGSVQDTVYEYDLSTAWDVSSASLLQSFSVAAQETSPAGLLFKTDGTKMYHTGISGDDVNEYDLSTAWDISTASYLQNFSVAAQETTPQGIFFKDDGTAFYVVGSGTDRVYSYTLGPQD